MKDPTDRLSESFEDLASPFVTAPPTPGASYPSSSREGAWAGEEEMRPSETAGQSQAAESWQEVGAWEADGLEAELEAEPVLEVETDLELPAGELQADEALDEASASFAPSLGGDNEETQTEGLTDE